MRLPNVVFAFALALLVLSAAPAAADPPMTFQVIYQGLYSNIFAQGEIESDTPEVFAAFLRDNHIPEGTTVYFLSGGGDLDAGVNLGRQIRRARLGTEVGIPGSGPIADPGECDSACTFAFLGGVTRTVISGSYFGVHRFVVEGGPPISSQQTEVSTQKEVGKLVAYVESMGVSPAMITLMSEGGQSRKKVKFLDPATMARLRITTHDVVSARMTTEADHPLVVVTDANGGFENGRMDFGCNVNHQLVVRAYFELPGAGFDPAAVSLAWWFQTNSGASSPDIPVPPQFFRAEGQRGDRVMFDVYVPLGPLFQSLMTASSIWLILHDRPQANQEDDILGFALTSIPSSIRVMLQTLARSC